jgi:hypothetical protein
VIIFNATSNCFAIMCGLANAAVIDLKNQISVLHCGLEKITLIRGMFFI